MIKRILAVIGGLVVLAVATVLIVAAGKPDTFRVARSIDVKAPPEKIYPYVADFHKWVDWSPFENMGAMTRSYDGAPFGVGAKYAWIGEDPGAGSMEIVQATLPTHIGLKLDFTKPFEAHNMVDFTFAPKGDVTTVTWDMHGPLPYVFKVVHVVLDMDNAVGKEFDKGLASLKTLAEK
jgi:hypothetical protein